MKIICTKEEKEIIKEAFWSSDACITSDEKCIGTTGCKDCIEKNIDWEIVEPEYKTFKTSDIEKLKENICDNFCHYSKFGSNADGECQYTTDHGGKCPLDSL